jgi:hypothetical protein
LTDGLWDDWAQSKLRLDATELAVRRAGISAGPIRRRLDEAAADAHSLVAHQVRDCVRAGLSWPGSPLVRAARRVALFLTALLPLLALLWVAWAIIVGYHRAVMNGSIPRDGLAATASSCSSPGRSFSLERWLRPSAENAASLRAGLRRTG